jgi:hypothetical protein
VQKFGVNVCKGSRAVGCEISIRRGLLTLPALSSGDHHVDLAAAASRADEPLASLGNGDLGAVPFGHLGRVELDPLAARL